MPALGFMPTTLKSLELHMAKLTDDELIELGKRYQKLGSMCHRELHHRRRREQSVQEPKVA
jgi:hypothetical protein